MTLHKLDSSQSNPFCKESCTGQRNGDLMGCRNSVIAMAIILPCYYLDEALGDDELAFVQQCLVGPWAKFKTGAAGVELRRVPAVLPMPDEQGRYAQSREQRAEGVRANLRHAGIRAFNGRQVVWVMPRDAEWDAIFEYAIREETGYAPFVAQRWFVNNDVLVRGPLRLLDTEMMIRAL
ncbi:MAG TPA: hypothetical protein VF450_04705 [Noviherbaspirillum sp.]